MPFAFHRPVPVAPRPPPPLCNARRPRWRSALIAVAGATGGVGSLLVGRLLSSLAVHHQPSQRQAPVATKVRALVRSIPRARKVLPGATTLELVHVPSTVNVAREALREALRGVHVLVICTGTTAFPTRAWRDGNTPRNVDDRGVRELVDAVDDCIQRVVLLSSVGTSRAGEFPFLILNAFGVMEAKRMGERHVEEAARRKGFSYAIIRPGRLIGAPHSNIGMMRSEPHPECMDVVIKRGDSLAGDLSREAAAEALFQAVGWDLGADLDFSVVHKRGKAPQTDEWNKRLKDVQFRRNPAVEAPPEDRIEQVWR